MCEQSDIAGLIAKELRNIISLPVVDLMVMKLSIQYGFSMRSWVRLFERIWQATLDSRVRFAIVLKLWLHALTNANYFIGEVFFLCVSV